MKKKLIKYLTVLMSIDYPDEKGKLHWVQFLRRSTINVKIGRDVHIIDNPLRNFTLELKEAKEFFDDYIDSRSQLTIKEMVNKFSDFIVERLIKEIEFNSTTLTDNYIARIKDAEGHKFEEPFYVSEETLSKKEHSAVIYYKNIVTKFNSDLRPHESKRFVTSVWRKVYKVTVKGIVEKQIRVK